MRPAVFIDDSGTTEKSKSKYDPGNWKSWMAIIVDSELITPITTLLEDLKLRLEISEFHFTEIFSGKNEFKNFSVNERIDIFWFFAEIFNKTNFPIFVQSLTDDDIIRNRMESIRFLNFDEFDFKNNSHLALWFLLKRITQHEILSELDKPIDFFVDSGIQKPNTSKKIKILNEIAHNNQINFIDSKSSTLMQLVDFAAFSLNRHRWILMNNKKSESDLEMLAIVQHANFNTLNLIKGEEIDINETDTTNLYDKLLRLKYNENGNLSDEKLQKRKNELR